jgi:hypothetical protein
MALKDLPKALHMIYQQLQEIILVVAEIREKNTVMKTQVDVIMDTVVGPTLP